ncbi:MAG: class I SAM-dependent methyltransferase [Nitrospirae bacterium]|nr:MAG: class I SAM-dependent methyltransferase [Nitrospirota bacterium]
MSWVTRFLIGMGVVWSVAVTPLMVGQAAPADQARWDRKYDTDRYIFGTEPIPFLRAHAHLLPKGKVLDIAMGEGRNGVYLATQGFDVTGIDISPVGLKKAQALAARHGVTIATQVVDLEAYTLPKNAYDVIICTYYLQRDLFPQIIDALKPGGMALVETYTIDHLKYRPRFPRAYLLKTNELLTVFRGMKVLRYQARDDGRQAYASILVQKP